MPSVVNGTKGNDSQDFYEKFVAVVEKKIRNVDKRKSKITTLMTQQKEGKVLDADQLAAVSKLPFVESNLEAMRELLPQFRSIITDAEKFNKRALRREEVQKKEAEQARVRGTLSTLHILSLLTQDTKEMLLNGHNGLTLTEAELSMLDQLYRATDSSSVAWSEVETQLTAASAVIIDLQDCKDKAAFDDVKFSQLNELLERLRTSEVFNPDYVAPLLEPEVVEVEEEVAEPEEEEVKEEAPVEVEEVIVEPEESAPTEEETALLNGDVPAEPEEEPIVDFMHDSHLDRSESQLSPLAPEFNPCSPEVSEGGDVELPADPEESEPLAFEAEDSITPDLEVETPVATPESPAETPPVEEEIDLVAATFGSFSQEETNNDCVTSDPAVMAWSTGPAVEEPVIITPPAAEPVAVEAAPEPVVDEAEPTNPWSKKSTLEWGNTSLPSEPAQSPGQVWGTPGALTPNSWANGPAVPQDADWPAAPVAAVAAPVEAVAEPAPLMKDQQTQKVFNLLVDEDGFTEQRRKGANKPRGQSTKPVVDNRGGFRGNNRGRYNNRTRGNDRENRGERREGGDRREGGERGARRGGGSFRARGESRGGSGGFRGERREGGSSGGYRGRGASRGGSADRGRPAPIPT